MDAFTLLESAPEGTCKAPLVLHPKCSTLCALFLVPYTKFSTSLINVICYQFDFNSTYIVFQSHTCPLVPLCCCPIVVVVAVAVLWLWLLLYCCGCCCRCGWVSPTLISVKTPTNSTEHCGAWVKSFFPDLVTYLPRIVWLSSRYNYRINLHIH